MRPFSRQTATPPGQSKLPRLPRDGEFGHPRLRRFLQLLTIAIGLMAAGVIIVFLFAWGTLQLPPDTGVAQSSTITDANGKPLATFSATGNSVPVQLGDVPPVVIQAVLDTEDHNFYKHNGVDARGTARALWFDLRNKSAAQGGSTITQQYVKQVYVGTERTPWRKFKEAILAVKLEQKLSKDEILERYLNTIYYGRGAYGVETASQAYFNKDVKQLTLPEASYLAGLIRGPELADVSKSPKEAASRRSLTLASMVQFGAITTEQQQAVEAKPLTSYVTPRKASYGNTPAAGKGTDYFVEYVKQTLLTHYSEQVVMSGGLKIKTSLDQDMQSKAYDSVYGLLKPNEPSGALVSIDKDGYIKAMVGGRDWKQSQVNLATGTAGGGSGRQAGSTFKPFELAAAVQAGVCYNETFPGPGSLVIPGWDSGNKPVENFGNESFGKINLIDATAHSVNTVYAQLVMKQGVGGLKNMAVAAGIPSNTLPKNLTPSLVLGSADVTPLDMAEAYLTFSQGGMHVDSTPVVEVRNASGDVLEKTHPKRTRVMSENTAAVVNKALQAVVSHGTGTAAQIGKPLAGKTGTTENNGDAWFVGYTPTLSTAVWMGYPEGSSHTMNNVRGIAVTGGSYPAQIFSNYMRYATRSAKATGFKGPDDCKSASSPPPTTTSTLATTTTPKPTTTTTTVKPTTTTSTTAKPKPTTTSSSTTLIKPVTTLPQQ